VSPFSKMWIMFGVRFVADLIGREVTGDGRPLRDIVAKIRLNRMELDRWADDGGLVP
jgi:hypothetical protein